MLAVAAIGLLLRHRVAHLVPPRSNPNHTRQASGKNHAPERGGTKSDHAIASERATKKHGNGGGKGRGRGAALTQQLAQGIGLGLLGSDRHGERAV